MISTDDVYDKLGISENEALEHFRRYTLGTNQLSGALGIVRYSVFFAFEILQAKDFCDKQYLIEKQKLS